MEVEMGESKPSSGAEIQPSSQGINSETTQTLNNSHGNNQSDPNQKMNGDQTQRLHPEGETLDDYDDGGDITGIWDFIKIHFSAAPEHISSRERDLLAHLTDHLPGFQSPHDVSDVMSLADLPTVVNVPKPEEEGEEGGDDREGLVGQVKHALVDMNGNVVKWFHHEAEMTHHMIKRSQTYSTVAPHLKELSKIPNAPSIFLQRHAPYKDLIIPTGPNSSFFDSLINMIKSIIGVGLLSLPLSFAWSGWAMATILMIAMGILNAYTCDLLIKMCTHLKLTSYNEIAEKAFGRWMAVFVDILTIVAGVGFLIASMVLLGDFGCSLVEAAAGTGTCNRVLVVYLISLATVFPLCLLRTLNSMRFLSFVSLTFLVSFTFVVLVLSSQSIIGTGGVAPTVVAWNWTLTIFRSLNVICFAYSCQYTTLPIFVELKRLNASNGYSFVDWATFICFILYFIVGLFGYLQFGAGVSSNVMLNYPASTLMEIMIGCFLFNIVVSYPLTNFAVRLSVDYLLFAGEYHRKKVNPNTQNTRMWFYTVAIYIIAASIGAFVTDVGPIFSITGATATSFLALILPPAIYLRLRQKNLIKKDSTLGANVFLVITSWICFFVGIAMFVLGLMTEIMGLTGYYD